MCLWGVHGGVVVEVHGGVVVLPRVCVVPHTMYLDTCTQCVEMVLGLISDSLDAWRTRQYDYYQRVLNGIL